MIKKLKYGNHYFDETGIKKRFSKEYYILWKDVYYISTKMFCIGGRCGYKTSIIDNTQKVFSLNLQYFFTKFSPLTNYIDLLNLIVDKVSKTSIDPKTEFIHKWLPMIKDLKTLKSKMTKAPNDIFLLNKLANIYRVKLKHNKAKKFFYKILETTPDNEDALLQIAVINFETGEEAGKNIKEFEYILKLQPDNILALSLLTQIYLDENRKEGLEYYRRLLEIKPGEKPVRLTVADYYCRNHNYSAAAQIYMELLEITDKPIEIKSYSSGYEYLTKLMEDPAFEKREIKKQKKKIFFNKLLFFYVFSILSILLLSGTTFMAFAAHCFPWQALFFFLIIITLNAKFLAVNRQYLKKWISYAYAYSFITLNLIFTVGLIYQRILSHSIVFADFILVPISLYISYLLFNIK